VRVVEHAAAVVVDESLRQCALGDDHVVRVEFDVEVCEALNALGLHDGDAVDEILGLDQHAGEIHRVIGRYPKVALRQVLAERAGLDADRQDVLAPHDEAAVMAPSPDPFDRQQRDR
jgi:hypothetical protein